MNGNMSVKEMKKLLASKLHEEGTYFTERDISMKKISKGYRIVIKDYEHIPFDLEMEEDEEFGFLTTVYTDWEGDYIFFDESKISYDPFHAILNLGYYIGTRF